MNPPSCSTVPLNRVDVGQPLVVASSPTDPVVARRMMTLGWRVGEQVRVVRRAVGGALVLDLDGARIAVGGTLARTLTVEPRA
ncbi:MAG: ferrous iron transport protein A [Propionibacteriaceae bacterium]|nr:ferrous iron transport protein A [Propionibacteriaceae bacterium]